MKLLKMSAAILALFAIGTLVACSGAPPKSPEVTDRLRPALNQAGLKAVTISHDRDKGIVTLAGQVATEAEKSQAEMLAKSVAGEQVVANQIAVVPVGGEQDAKVVNSDLDKGIEVNLDAALIQNKMHDTVKYDVKNAVVTLTGEVVSQELRASAESVAMMVPNVKQVVNSLQVKNQKSTSSK